MFDGELERFVHLPAGWSAGEPDLT